MVNQQNRWGHFHPMPERLPLSLTRREKDPPGHTRHAQVWNRRPQFGIYFGRFWLAELFLAMNSSMLCCSSLAVKGKTRASCGRRRGWALRQSETSIQASPLRIPALRSTATLNRNARYVILHTEWTEKVRRFINRSRTCFMFYFNTLENLQDW